MAHDFNNLLTAITGNAELMLMDLPEEDPNRQDVEEIRKAGNRAAALTQQLLAFSRRQILQPKVLDMNQLLSGTDRMLRRLLGDQIELVTLLTSSLGYIRADPGQMEQVIVNLAVNARDAMAGKGRLIVQTSNFEVSEPLVCRPSVIPPGAYVVLAVSDNGSGMDKQTLERIFEPFFTTKGPGAGTGLGLATVYGIVEQSGGYISVYSAPGEGSTFKVYLPQVVDMIESRVEESMTEVPGGTETILVVEDQATVRAMTYRILERKGYNVLEAENGEEALRVWEQHQQRIELVLTDMTMPLMNGRELVGRLSEMEPNIRVLYMSGFTHDLAMQRGDLGSGAAFIAKPFTPSELARKVREVLDVPRPRSSQDAEEDLYVISVL